VGRDEELLDALTQRATQNDETLRVHRVLPRTNGLLTADAAADVATAGEALRAVSHRSRAISNESVRLMLLHGPQVAVRFVQSLSTPAAMGTMWSVPLLGPPQ
jgi:hypothetical protein